MYEAYDTLVHTGEKRNLNSALLGFADLNNISDRNIDFLFYFNL